jgi:hypothetical protein
LRRAAALSALFSWSFLAAATPALADPAVPTEYESQVTGIDPATDAIQLNVVGGDSFLAITVQAGHSVMVAGYFGEPYLQIDAGGVVSVNERSPSKYVNDDRFGDGVVPESASADAAPQWQVVATSGSYAWHDHRTHWMATDRPPGISGDTIQQVFEWELPIEIDGVGHLVLGTLDWHPAPNGALPFLGGALVLLALVGWRRGRIRLLAIVVSVAAGGALLLSISQWLATPAVARGLPLAAVPPVIALVLGVMAASRAATRPVTAVQSLVVAAVALVVFVFASLDVFTKPLLPAALPDIAERLIAAGVAWAALGSGVLAVAHMVRIASGTGDDAAA